jgi:hypothetical protein
MKKEYPLPWGHVTDNRKMSAVLDADGHVVCGSLISQREKPKADREAHALIVKAVNKHAEGRESYLTNIDTDLPMVPIGQHHNGTRKKTTHCTAEEILGRVIEILGHHGSNYATDIRELILQWQHS